MALMYEFEAIHKGIQSKTPTATQVAVAHRGHDPDFEGFPKIARWSRDIIITEKLDGTNGQIFITESGDVLAGSRNRWLNPEHDNFGFAAWVEEQADTLRAALGPGRHFGEWWGLGIQRGYGLSYKQFSLFNVHRWHCEQLLTSSRSVTVGEKSSPCPSIVSVVPVLYSGPISIGTFAMRGHEPIFKGDPVDVALSGLREVGSFAVPGYKNPEGIVIYHTASKESYKKTLLNDEKGKES